MEKLCSHADTKGEGQALEDFKVVIETGVRWRSNNHIPTLDADKYKRERDLLAANGLIFTAPQCQSMVKRESDIQRSEGKYDAYTDTTWPFGPDDASFDHENPGLSCVPRVQSWKLSCYHSTVMQGCLCRLIMEGKAALMYVKGLARAGQRKVEETDVIMMEADAAAFHGEIKLCFDAVITIIELPFSTEHVTAVSGLASKGRPATGVSPITAVARAVEVTEFYRVKQEHYMTVMTPLVLKHEDAFARHMEVLGLVDGGRLHQCRINGQVDRSGGLALHSQQQSRFEFVGTIS